MQRKVYKTSSFEKTVQLGSTIGQNLRGGEIIELTSDLGGGKTTFTRGLVSGFGSSEPVASPSFTISYVYSRADKKQVHHFDFYRLTDAGVVGAELAEVLGDPETVTVIEWGEIVHTILPAERVVIRIVKTGETNREIHVQYHKNFSYLFNE